jgi:hypothetical protein
MAGRLSRCFGRQKVREGIPGALDRRRWHQPVQGDRVAVFLTLESCAHRNRSSQVGYFWDIFARQIPTLWPMNSGRLFRDIKDSQQLAGLPFPTHLNGVQGVAGSNPVVPTQVSEGPTTIPLWGHFAPVTVAGRVYHLQQGRDPS